MSNEETTPAPEAKRSLLNRILEDPKEMAQRLSSHLDELDETFFDVLAEEVRRRQDAGADDDARRLLRLPEAIALLHADPKREREWAAAAKAFEKARDLANAGDLPAARRESAALRQLYQRVKYDKGRADAALLSARIELMAGQPAQAAELLREAAELYQGRGFWDQESTVLGRLGQLLQEQGKIDEARATFERLLGVAAAVRLRASEGLAHLGLGQSDLQRDDRAAARPRFEKALARGDELADPWLRANSHANLGSIALDAGDRDAARKHLELAERFFREADLEAGVHLVRGLQARLEAQEPDLEARFAQAQDLEQQALQAKQRGEPEVALGLRQRSIEILREIGDAANECVIRTNLGNLYRDEIGDPESALAHYEEALKLARAIGRLELQGMVLRQLGKTYQTLAQDDRAAAYLRDAVAVAEASSDDRTLADALIDAGNQEKDANRPERALPLYERARAIAERAGAQESLVLALGNLGNVKELQHDWPAASALYLEGLELARRIGFTQGVMNQSSNLSRSGDAAADVVYAREALAAAQSLGSFEYQAAAWSNLASAFERAGRWHDALDSLERAFPLFRRTTRRGWQAKFHKLRAEIHEKLERHEAADADWQAANRVYEEVADQRFARVRDISVFRDLAESYRPRTRLAVALGRAEKAWELLEEVKSKPLRARTGTETLALSATAELLAAQERVTAFVHFGFLGEETTAVVWRSDRRRPELERMPLGIHDLGDACQRFLEEVDHHVEQPDLEETWLEIGDELLAGVVSHLAGCELVYFSPQSLLWNLPLHGLCLGGRRLLEDHLVVYVDSFTRLAALQQRPSRPRERALAAGVALTSNDDAIFEGEAKIAARSLGTEAHVGHQVTRQLLLDELPEADAIHLSAHGLWRYRGAELILCHESERLGIGEIERFEVTADLVFLSGCDTGWCDGEAITVGPRGLHVAFVEAGAASVVAPGWPIPSPVSLQIVDRFYHNLVDEKRDKAEALREAQLAILDKPRYRGHTYYWAPFSLFGDWR